MGQVYLTVSARAATVRRTVPASHALFVNNAFVSDVYVWLTDSVLCFCTAILVGCHLAKQASGS